MSSPIIKQVFASITWNKLSEKALYLQVADAILTFIKTDKLRSGQKLPSTRALADLLQLNRITIAKAYEELQIQGWLESFIGRGTFVSAYLPELKPENLVGAAISGDRKSAGFDLLPKAHLHHSAMMVKGILHLDDGFPDPSLAPLKELHRAYRSQLSRTNLYAKFGRYSHPAGSETYREAVSRHLNETRGLKTTADQVLSVRGTVMGINLVCNALIRPGDVVVSGIPGWRRAEYNFIHAGAEHIGIAVDEHGLKIEELQAICQQKQVRMVYVTPHHHYPTTVSLRIDRRLELLRLANAYKFIIFEDDYDYDFHYKQRPLLPLASADEKGMVIYGGSFSKSFSPAFRMGYLVASADAIDYLANARSVLDRQGDHILDNAMGELLNDGTITRYLRRALGLYRERRDFFCDLLHKELGGQVRFVIPEGGMTVWATFDESVDLGELAKDASHKGLYLSDGKAHQYVHFRSNAIRLGFASSTLKELAESVRLLKGLLHR